MYYHLFVFFFNDTATTEIYTLTHSFPTRRSSDLSARRAQGSLDQELSGDPHPHQQRARRAGRGSFRRRAAAAPRRPARRRQLSQHRGPDREEFSARTQRWRCRGFASPARADPSRSEEHTSELQSLMRISYAVFCLKQKTLPP